MPSRELVVWSLLTPSHETLARDFFLRSLPAGCRVELHRVDAVPVVHGEPGWHRVVANKFDVLRLQRLCESRDCRIAWLDAVTDEQLARAVDAMHEHPERRHSVESLAGVAGMSRSAFGERFTRAFDRSPMDYLRELRLQRGARLLKTTELGVQQIARKVGFSSRSHFSQAFADLYGRPPAEYRVGA